MAFPVGVTTRSITFSTATDAEDGTANVVRAIVACNDKLVHIATAVWILPSPQIFTASPFILPVTDQSSIWSDGEGNVLLAGSGFHTHSYRIDLEASVAGQWVSLKSLEKVIVPTSGSPLDLDLLFNANRIAYDAG